MSIDILHDVITYLENNQLKKTTEAFKTVKSTLFLMQRLWFRKILKNKNCVLSLPHKFYKIVFKNYLYFRWKSL